MVLLLVLGNTKSQEQANIITRWEGILLLLLTVIYIIYTIYEEKTVKNEKIDKEIINDVESKQIKSTLTIAIYMILGILGLKFGSDLVVDNSVLIAERFGLSEKLIGITIVAVGTALPEIITGIISSIRNETDLLIGNISGSTILNLCLLTGLGAVINPLTFSTDFNSSLIILIIITIFLQWIATKNKKSELNKEVGVFLIVAYIIYIISMI